MFSYKKHFSSNEKSSMLKDFELLISSEINNKTKVLKKDKDELKFFIKLYHLFKIQSSLPIERIKFYKLRNTKIINNKLYIPYWIQFNYNFHRNEIDYIFSIFWIKKNNDIIKNIEKELNNIDKPLIYKVIDIIKSNLENTLTENNIISFLTEIKFNNNKNLSFENALFELAKANKDCPDFLYEEEMDDLINFGPNGKNYLNLETIVSNNKSNLSEYNLFFENGGVISEILEENELSFLCHGIKIKSKEEKEKYLKYIYSNNKIKNAMRNVFGYTYKDENTGNIIEDYDDYGENYSGIRLLEYLKDSGINNIFILVTRFNGEIPLKKHSPKYLTIVEILIKNNEKYLTK